MQRLPLRRAVVQDLLQVLIVLLVQEDKRFLERGDPELSAAIVSRRGQCM